MFSLYRFITKAASPLIDFYLKRRKKKGREDSERFRERYGFAGLPRPQGKLAWFHAASIGEATSVLPLIVMILRNYPQMHILVTTGTVTSARLLASLLPERAFHQYVPIDRPDAVRRFVQHWQPEIAFWVESELWPNLIHESSRHGCPMILLNARISDNSFRMWKYFRPFAGKLLRPFSLCLAQSLRDAERLEKLGSKNVKFLGNLKYDSAELAADPKEYARLTSAIGSRDRWIAASTHPGEEEIIKDVHMRLKRQYPGLLTIIVPRHPVRGPEIAEQLKSPGIVIALRSRGEPITMETSIYIADTIGELGIFYRLSSIVFMGGSLVRHGGQNPLEPARLDAAVITGMYHRNFADIYQQMAADGAVTVVDNAKELAVVLARLLGHYDICEELAHKAREFTEERSGVAETYLQEIKQYLDKI